MSKQTSTVPVVVKTEKAKPVEADVEVESVASSSETLGSQDTESSRSESEYEEQDSASEHSEAQDGSELQQQKSLLRTLFSSLAEGSGDGIEVGDATRAPWGLNTKLKIEAETNTNSRSSGVYRNMAIGGALGVISGFVYSLLAQ